VPIETGSDDAEWTSLDRLSMAQWLTVPRRTVQWVRRDDRAGWLMGRQVAAARAPITELVSGTSRCVKYAAA
jgi:hypothetical protein